MFNIQIADLVIAINNKYPFVEKVCANYITDRLDYDFSVSATEYELNAEKSISEIEFSDGYIESICIYRSIAKELPKYNAFVMHCAAIDYKGKAYCFSAKSGTGKTTHIKLWHKVFGDDVIPINGDKPIFRLIGDSIYVYGTPWSGKEDYNTNIKSPLNGLCFLQRAEKNSITSLPIYQALNLTIPQIYVPNDDNTLDKTLSLIDKMLSDTPLWILKCNISEDAARIAFNAMTNNVLD